MKQQSFSILILLTLFSSALISIIMPMAKEIKDALSLESEAQILFINAMFLLVGAASSIGWSLLADKFSRKNMLIIGTLLWSSFTLLTTFAYDFYSLLFFQLIAAIGFGSSIPLIFSLLVDIVDVEKRGVAFGRLSAFYVIGQGLGHILSGFLNDTRWGWVLPFIIISIGGFVCFISLFFMDEPLRGGMDKIYNLEDESVMGLSYKIRIKDFKQIWLIKTIILIIIFNFIMFIAIGAISSNFITMLKNKNDYNFDSDIATIFLIIIFGSQIISGPVIGKLADKKYENDQNGRIKYVLICIVLGSIVYLIGFSLLFTSPNLPMTIIFIILIFIGAFLFGGIDPLTQATLGDISPPQIRSTVYSINFLAYMIGRSISILILAGFFLYFNDSYQPGYLLLSLFALTCSLMLIIILKTLPRDLNSIESKRSNNKENE